MDLSTCGAFCLLLISYGAAADDWHIVDVDKVYVDYMYNTWAVEPYLANKGFTPTNRLDLHVNLNLFSGYGFFENMVHSEIDQTQFRKIGWQYRIGGHFGKHLDLYFEHFSQHMLDSPAATANTYDAIGARVYLYRDKSK